VNFGALTTVQRSSGSVGDDLFETLDDRSIELQ